MSIMNTVCEVSYFDGANKSITSLAYCLQDPTCPHNLTQVTLFKVCKVKTCSTVIIFARSVLCSTIKLYHFRKIALRSCSDNKSITHKQTNKHTPWGDNVTRTSELNRPHL